MKTPVRAILILLGSAIMACGLCNIHAFSNVTEGGVLGATLLLDHWCGISPALSSLFLNALCYLFGLKTLGRDFLFWSAVATVGYSIAYALFEPFAPLFPLLISSPLAAALSGAVFVGVGAGLCVRFGCAPSGDDALAMVLNRITKVDIQWLYLITDLTVLLLSLTYIPLTKIAWSLLTVVLSGQIIGLMQRIPGKKA